MNLDSLIKIRKEWVKSSKENTFDFDNILSGLYVDPTHFIFELIQNAEDVKACNVKFDLFDDNIDFYHDGKDFDINDINGVTGIGISTKVDDILSIGKFGVGFKSVFAISETPHIYSGEYKIRIDDFVIPTILDDEMDFSNSQYHTLIRLPLIHKKRTREELFKSISLKLANLNLKTILFLRNIEKVFWQCGNRSDFYEKEVYESIENYKKVKLKTSTIEEYFLIFENEVEIGYKKIKIEIAFKLEKNYDGKEKITSEKESNLFVFFPTEKPTDLNFLIQSPFKTTPNRENIPMDDPQNNILLESIATLTADCLLQIKKLGFLDVDFLNLLPIDPEIKEKNHIYSIIFDSIRKKFLNEELLPTSVKSEYSNAGNVILARGKDLTEFLSPDDINHLYSKRNWLDTNITYDRTRDLRDYLLKELNVEEVEFVDFARKLTIEFLKTKSDIWMIGFYSRLLEQQSLWGYNGILRTKPIIRLENGDQESPFDNNGKIRVYLPTENQTEYKTVKKALTENNNSLRFLKELGLKEPDLFSEIEEFILPKYRNEKNVKDENYINDFEKIVKAYDKIPSEHKENFKEELKDTKFILSINNITSEECLKNSSEVYFKDKNLVNYFQGYESVYFVPDLLFKQNETKVKTLLKDLGVTSIPRRISIEGTLNDAERNSLIFTPYAKDIQQTDIDLQGLDTFLYDLDSEKSFLIWELLLRAISDLSSSQAKDFFLGEMSWKYYSYYSVKFDSRFLKTLKDTRWMLNSENQFFIPNEIKFSELNESYLKDSPNIEVLINILGLKNESDAYSALPEDQRKKLELIKNIPFEDLERFTSEIEKAKKDSQREKWKEDVEPDYVISRISDLDPELIITLDRSNQTTNDSEDRDNNDSLYKHIKPKYSNYNDIGNWGEKYVINSLKDKYKDNREIEVILLNTEYSKGRGYDIVIKENETEIEYIEVKSKTENGKELIEVTGAQWEFARKLYDNGEGDKYIFYIVHNTGTLAADIRVLKNPIKLWKEGKLYAHPVNFKL